MQLSAFHQSSNICQKTVKSSIYAKVFAAAWLFGSFHCHHVSERHTTCRNMCEQEGKMHSSQRVSVPWTKPTYRIIKLRPSHNEVASPTAGCNPSKSSSLFWRLGGGGLTGSFIRSTVKYYSCEIGPADLIRATVMSFSSFNSCLLNQKANFAHETKGLGELRAARTRDSPRECVLANFFLKST